MEIKPSPLFIIDQYDENHSIRVVGLDETVREKIWNGMSNEARKITSYKRYFHYKLDNPPLHLVLEQCPRCASKIIRVKGHGASKAVKIPKIMDRDLGYILGFLRDGGIHHDEKSNAYKVHFAEKDKLFLEREVLTRLERLFGLCPRITLRPDGVYQIQFASKPIYLLLKYVFQMKEIQQYWTTPDMIKVATLDVKAAYIKGFHDAEGSSDHIYHSWFKEDECEPLQFITETLNDQFNVRCSRVLRIKTSDEFDRFPAYQIFINDYTEFRRKILDEKP